MVDRRPTLHALVSAVALTGVAGLATVIGLAPAATAAVDEAAPDSSEPTRTPTDKPAAATDTAEPAAADEIVADFGMQKFRVGVQIADGSWVPAGTSTATSTFTITETGPLVDGTETTICATYAPMAEDLEPGAPTASFCKEGTPEVPADISASGQLPGGTATGGVDIDPDESEPRGSDYFRARAGSTVTIRQETAGPNLAKTTTIATIEPCLQDPENENNSGYCPGNYTNDTRLSTVLFRNVGLPPVATDDVRTTTINTPLDIEVLTNDDTVNGAPLTKLVAVTAPANGTTAIKGAIGAASVKATATGPVITYTPRNGFTGTDTFDYTLSTPNGTATATVTITIPAAAVPADPTDEPADPTDEPAEPVDEPENGPLPQVGGFDERLLGYGAALIIGGAALTVTGRRRVS